MENPIVKKFLDDLRADQEAWEKEHFGDDKEALASFYGYCLDVAKGTEAPTVLKTCENPPEAP